MKKVTYCSGRTGRTIVTTTILGNTKHIVVIYPNGNVDSQFIKIQFSQN